MRNYVLMLLFSIGGFVGGSAFASNGANVSSRNNPDIENEQEYLPAILVVENDAELEQLVNSGFIVWHRRADMVLGVMPDNDQPECHNLPEKDKRNKKPISFKHRAKPALDIARQYFDADKIHSGTNTTSAFTGRGTVVGFVDSGFDPNHIAFLDSESNSRVKRIVYYEESKGIRKVVDTPHEIQLWTTDDVEMSHATHVAGIMAGGYGGEGYLGIAPDADIVAATSELYDAGILSACEDIIEYAKSVGRPAVINLSLGSYNGPHDGSSLFSRYLSLLGKEAIICVAAGNEGDDDNSYRITFSDSKPAWRTRIHSSDWSQFNMYGMTDVWSADERPVGIKFHIYDENDGVSIFSYDISIGADEETITISSDTNSDFAQYMTGSVVFTGGICELNGRWRMEMEYETSTEEPNKISEGNWARYNLGLEIFGTPNLHADVTSDCQYSRLVQWPGYDAPNADLSLSDMATTRNVISVGMYNNRAEAPLLSGDIRRLEEPMTINHGSGYAIIDGDKIYPHTVAPGGWVISACSGPYATANPDDIPCFSAKSVINGKTYYWNLNAGTSMSTPYVAGTIATWLEADPTLTVEKVLEILKETNLHDYPSPDDPRHGQGWFAPYTGLLRVLGLSGITPGAIDHADIRIVVTPTSIEIYNPSSVDIEAQIHTIYGKLSSTDVIKGEIYTEIPKDRLASGVYILTCRTDMKLPSVTKFMIK